MTFEQAGHDGLFVIVTSHADRSAPYSRNHGAALHTSWNPLTPESWEPVTFPGLLSATCTLHFCGADLLIVQDDGIFLVPDIRGSGRTAHPLLTIEPWKPGRDHPGEYPFCVTSGSGQQIVQLAGQFYLWTGTRLAPQHWPLHKASNSCTVATANGFCYVHSVFDRTVSRLYVYLVEINTRTGQERARRLQFLREFSFPQALPQGWVAFAQNGEPDITKDLAQLWHMPTDRWFRLPDGCLGRGRLKRLFAAPDGHLLAFNGGELFRLPPLETLVPHLKKMKNGCLTPEPWSEWSDSAPGIAGEWQLSDALRTTA